MYRERTLVGDGPFRLVPQRVSLCQSDAVAGVLKAPAFESAPGFASRRPPSFWPRVPPSSPRLH